MQLKIKGQRKSKSKKVYIGYLLLIAAIAGIGGYFLAKEQYDVVTAEVYKCYYGEPRSGINNHFEIKHLFFEVYCYNESIGCPPFYEEKYYQNVTTYRSELDKVMLNYSRGAVLDTEQIRVAFSELCRFGFCDRNTSPYLGDSNRTSPVSP
jgi:hypothetical protein